MSESARFLFLNNQVEKISVLITGWRYRLCQWVIFVALAVWLAFPIQAQTTDGDGETEKNVAITLSALADYMVQLKKGFAQFSQLNADGTTSKGHLIVERPTNARLEYHPPSSGLIIADSFRVAVFDLKSNTAPIIIPLRSTPLYFLLKDNIRIDDTDVLVSYNIGAASSEVMVRGGSENDRGSMRLLFRHSPIELAGWIYMDQFGQITRMTFESLVPEIEIDPNIFDIDGEIRRLNRN